MNPLLLNQGKFAPNSGGLLDGVMEHLEIKNDAALARALQFTPATISKIRNRRLQISAAFMLRIHEITELPFSKLRAMMGDQQARFRLVDTPVSTSRNIGITTDV